MTPEISEFPNDSEIERLQSVGILALQQASHTHNLLGERGLERVSTNQFGQNALRADVECEEAVFDTLKNTGIDIRIVSEEHGTFDIGNNPKLLGMVDGIDGTNRYIAGRGKERYGTMFGFYQGLDPKYSDYLFGGIFIHSTRQLFYAGRNLGAHVLDNGSLRPIRCSTVESLEPGKTKLLADTLFDEEYKKDSVTTMLKRLSNFDVKCLRATCVHFADLVNGAVDAVIEPTKKGNLETGAAFAIIDEAGGVILDLDGNNLANERFLSFGQSENIPLIYAANQNLARDVIRSLSI